MQLINVYNKCLDKVNFIYENLDGEFPHITKDGEWLTNTSGHWTGGFWTGLLWLNYLTNNSSTNLNKVLNQTKKLSVRVHDNKTHDMGFIFGPSCVFGSNIQSNSKLEKMAISGAYNMESLLVEKVGLVLAWDEIGYENLAIVDTIMNAPLMIWASQKDENEDLYNKGILLADTIRKNHLRSDYSIFHMVKWDTKNYDIVDRTTHQGYSSETCWSRGQAWALYGFANMYRYTGKLKYLEISKNLAEYYWGKLDNDTMLPKWDFYFKNSKDEPIDSAAASIAASGFLLLSKMLSSIDKTTSEIWKKRGEDLINAILENCLYDSMDKYGIIKKVTVDKPRNSGVNESSMYADYYFMEALYRYLNYENEDMLSLLY